jgi:hypothetical protein
MSPTLASFHGYVKNRLGNSTSTENSVVGFLLPLTVFWLQLRKGTQTRDAFATLLSDKEFFQDYSLKHQSLLKFNKDFLRRCGRTGCDPFGSVPIEEKKLYERAQS